MANVKIDITVDTVKLLAQFPKGGEITDHTIIVMTDNQGDGSYQTEFKDKLITRSPQGVSAKWKISSLNKKELLDFVAFIGDKNTLNVFEQKPNVNAADKTEFDGAVKKGMTQAVSTEYFLSFCFKQNPDVIWSWDPTYIVPYPPK